MAEMQAVTRLKSHTYTCMHKHYTHSAFLCDFPRAGRNLSFIGPTGMSENKQNSAKAMTEFHGDSQLQRTQSTDINLISNIRMCLPVISSCSEAPSYQARKMWRVVHLSFSRGPSYSQRRNEAK